MRFKHPISFTNDSDFISLVRSFIHETQNMQILALGGMVVSQDQEPLCQDLLAQRLAFADDVLVSDNTPILIRKMLKSSVDGIRFFKAK